jgi:hypothetical protein
MSCPFGERFEWRRLSDDTAESEPLRDELRPHLSGCAPCRERALRLDPTLVFATTPAVVVTAAELDEMRQRIAGARRLLDGERSAAPPRAARQLAGRAAAVLLPALLAAGVWGGLRGRVAAPPVVAVAGVEASAPALRDRLLAERLDGMPLVERPEDSAPEIVYQVEGETFDLVLLVDAGLELGGP